MTDSDRSHVHPRSTAKIGGHPIHPMLVPFPIVCFIGVLVTDIVFLNNQDAGWATASRYLLGIGIVMALLAAVAGLTDFMGSDRIRSMGDAVKHMLANVTAVVLEVLLWRRGPERTRLAWGAAAVGTLLLAFTIWNLDQHGWCDPRSMLQGHAVWHVLCAVSAWMLFRLWASERVEASGWEA